MTLIRKLKFYSFKYELPFQDVELFVCGFNLLSLCVLITFISLELLLKMADYIYVCVTSLCCACGFKFDVVYQELPLKMADNLPMTGLCSSATCVSTGCIR